MAYTWIKLPKSKGVEYRLLSDGQRYYRLRSTVNGKSYTDGIGSRTEDEVREIKSILDRNRKIGRGPQSYEEMIQTDVQAKREEAKERELEKLNSIKALSEKYLADRETNDSFSLADFKALRSRHTKWIQPHLGNVLFSELNSEIIEDFVKFLESNSLSARSIKGILSQLKLLWAYAIKKKIVKDPQKPFPGTFVEKPALNNKRMAFLSWEQAQELLEYFNNDEHKDIHDYCVLTLYTGMRPSEIHRLTWNAIDTGLIFKTKNGKQRYVFFQHPVIQAMLDSRRAMYPNRQPHDLVFPRNKPDKNGRMDTPRNEIPDSFDYAVAKLGFYKPIPAPDNETPREKTLRRQENRNKKIVFYSLRHTFASWLVQQGTPLYIVRDAMGHSSQEITERYAHLSPTHIQQAVSQLPVMEISPTKKQQKALPEQHENIIDTEFSVYVVDK